MEKALTLVIGVVEGPEVGLVGVLPHVGGGGVP
jgi:hypothetical protein